MTATALAALLLAACGEDGIEVPEEASTYEGAVLFAERCSGCHTMKAAGAEGSGNRGVRPQGPNFDEREESFDEVLFAIRNGGFSGSIMPQNIVVGEEAVAVSRFVEEWSGTEIEDQPLAEAGDGADTPGEPGAASGSEGSSSSGGAGE